MPSRQAATFSGGSCMPRDTHSRILLQDAVDPRQGFDCGKAGKCGEICYNGDKDASKGES